MILNKVENFRLIIIGDGAFKDGNNAFYSTVNLIKKLYDDKGIITFTVGYGEENNFIGYGPMGDRYIINNTASSIIFYSLS